MSDVATVELDPVHDGAVTDFRILHIDRETASETVTVDATLHLPSGAFARKQLVLTLKKQRDGKLIVTGVLVGRTPGA